MTGIDYQFSDIKIVTSPTLPKWKSLQFSVMIFQENGGWDINEISINTSAFFFTLKCVLVVKELVEIVS